MCTLISKNTKMNRFKNFQATIQNTELLLNKSFGREKRITPSWEISIYSFQHMEGKHMRPFPFQFFPYPPPPRLTFSIFFMLQLSSSPVYLLEFWELSGSISKNTDGIAFN